MGIPSLRVVTGVLAAELFLLAAAMANTPERTEWLARTVPGLAFLQHPQNVMTEYGFRYEDPEIGTFFSRLSPEALARHDATHGVTAAAILDAYRSASGDRYQAFLATYRPGVDPFLHEARVHLFRRDRLRKRAAATADPQRRRRLLDMAWREHRILQRYFPNTLAHSSYRLSVTEEARLRAAYLPEATYRSPVSRGLITAVSQRTLVGGLALGGLLLLGLRSYLGRRARRAS